MDTDDAQEGPRNSMAQREMEHAKSGNDRMSHMHLKDEARVAHAGGRNCTEQPGDTRSNGIGNDAQASGGLGLVGRYRFTYDLHQ
jgi:hypothetical protein